MRSHGSVPFTALGFAVILNCAVGSAPAETPQFRSAPACGPAVAESDVCQKPLPAAPSGAPAGLSVHRNDEYLDIVFAADANTRFLFGDAPFTCCDIQTFLLPMSNGIWGVRLRVPQVDDAALPISIANIPGAKPPSVAYFGPKAPPPILEAGPDAPAISGLTHETIASKVLGATRKLTVYRGRTCTAGPNRCRYYYLADGENVDSFVRNVPPSAAGKLARVVLVGIENPPDTLFGPNRMGELLKGVQPDLYGRFQAYVLTEVIPHIEGSVRISPERRLVVGVSNGAAWALDVAPSHPEVFGGAAAFSPGRDSGLPPPGGRGRYFLGAGLFETRYRQTPQSAAVRLRRAGAHVEEKYVVGGHSLGTWNQLFWWMISEDS